MFSTFFAFCGILTNRMSSGELKRLHTNSYELVKSTPTELYAVPHFDPNMQTDIKTNFITLNLLLQFCHQYAKKRSAIASDLALLLIVFVSVFPNNYLSIIPCVVTAIYVARSDLSHKHLNMFVFEFTCYGLEIITSD